MKGEDKEQYLKLRAAIAESVQAKTPYDMILVNDQTNKLWEEMRLRGNSKDLIEAGYIKVWRVWWPLTFLQIS